MEDVEDVNAWFARRGFLVRESETDYSAQVRSSPSGRTAASRDLHIWVDLLSADGRLVHPAYGSGNSVWDAMTRAKHRYMEEQEGRDPRGSAEPS